MLTSSLQIFITFTIIVKFSNYFRGKIIIIVILQHLKERDKIKKATFRRIITKGRMFITIEYFINLERFLNLVNC